MRILIVSDTHKKIARVIEIYNKLAASSQVDLIIHCGDYYEDALKIERRLGKRVVAVRGNCDGCFDENEFRIVETEAGNFFICHGHMDDAKHSKQGLYYHALEENCVGAIFGHTHRAGKTELDDFIFINPGSITKPRDGSGGSFAILDTARDYKYARILKYEDFMASGSVPPMPPSSSSEKPKVSGGFLRRIFNYSDGQ